MFEFIGFLVALCLAFWVFSDAKARGKTTGGAFLWFLGTLLLLIVFLPLWLFIRPKKTHEVIVVGKPTLCVHCGKYYEGTPTFCPNCGQQMRVNNA
ncbi:MAG: hypothetical protein FDZ69_00300 [Deltaproteobacteria bacterium]|nr:MAG: hypothetical protein FDZ69_00300 [Deltaproteobacteria bacterium]